MLDKAFQKVGKEHAIHVVTDSASNCKAAGALLEAKYPQVTWTPCAAHIIDLCMEDVGRLKVVEEVVTIGKQIVHFVKYHTVVWDKFKELSKGVPLIRPGATRCAFTNTLLHGCLRLTVTLCLTGLGPTSSCCSAW